MLAPLTDDDRGRVAPRLSAASLSMRPQLRGSSAELLVTPIAASTDPNGTNAGVAHSPHPRPRRGEAAGKAGDRREGGRWRAEAGGGAREGPGAGDEAEDRQGFQLSGRGRERRAA